MKKALLATTLTFSAIHLFGVQRYGTGLDSLGSREHGFTIFTTVGEDAAREARISWAGQRSLPLQWVVIDDGQSEKVVGSVVEDCVIYDSVYSKLSDNKDVYERHKSIKHSLDISGLKPDTEYSYYVTTDTAGAGWKSEPRTFRTAPLPGTSWRAAVIGDFHHYSPLWRRLDNAMAMLDTVDSIAGGVNFVLSPGDQCAWGGSFNYWTELSEQPAYKHHVWAPVQGNHDHMDRTHYRTDEYFRNAWNLPKNGYEGQEGVTYWFKYGDVLFLMLNNEAMRDEASLQKAHKWIEEVVAANPSRYIVAVEHYEWIIVTDGSDSQLERFADLFTRLGVSLAISGNNHAYLRTKPLHGTRVAEEGENTTVYVVAPSSDGSRGRDLKDLVGHQDVIATRWSEGPNTVGAMLLDVDPSRMSLTLYDRAGTAVDTVTVLPSKIPY